MIRDKYKDLYISTSNKQLKKLSGLLLTLEKKPEGEVGIASIFRLIHSMKGAAATMGYKNTVKLLHAMEDIIQLAYQGKLLLNSKIIDNFFTIAKSLDQNLQNISRKEKEINLNKETKLARACAKIGRKTVTKSSRVKADKDIVNDLHIESSISIPSEKLNIMSNVLDDLLISTMKTKSLAKKMGHGDLLSNSVEADTLVNNLRRELQKLRVVPLADVFSSLPYLVRNIAKAEDKEVEFTINDNDLSLDKSILDDLVEVLVQLLKNAVVHGISDKQKNGKVDLEANIVNDQVIIRVKDNGHGINWREIKSLAVKRKIVTWPKLKKMSEIEIHNLIFGGGISSQKKANTRSGRGIGLSLVKERVDVLGGEIEIDSGPKKGTTFTLNIPLPLSIFRAISFHIAKYPLAIPLAHVKEVIKLEEVKDYNKQKFYKHKRKRYKMMSLLKSLSLSKFKGLSKYVALIDNDKGQFALPIYSNVRDREVVMKRTPRVLKKINYIKGVAVSASGQPVLILNVNNLK